MALEPEPELEMELGPLDTTFQHSSCKCPHWNHTKHPSDSQTHSRKYHQVLPNNNCQVPCLALEPAVLVVSVELAQGPHHCHNFPSMWLRIHDDHQILRDLQW